jgi:TRAP-type mannitol/chloroaromatic compound transport system permease small subunit
MGDMQRMVAIADGIDRINAAIGRAATWCVLAMVLVQFLVVLLRYLFGIGSIWLSETIVYAHAALFLLAAAWTLSVGGHVRVDIFYAGASPRRRAWIDLAGAFLLLLPFMLAIFMLAIPYVARSWATLERSRESSGLPLIFLLKTLIPIFAGMLALQGLVQAVRAWQVLVAPNPITPHRPAVMPQ